MVPIAIHPRTHTKAAAASACFLLIDPSETTQHCCSQIDVTSMLFSTVICLLALILKHVDVSITSPTADIERE